MKKNLFLRKMALSACFFLFAGIVSAQTEQTASKEFTTVGTSTWSLPTDVYVTGVSFEAIGGGGAGGYSKKTSTFNLNFQASGGGSGAAYAKTTLSTFSQGQTFSISVGGGGTNPNGTATNGGNSVVNSNSKDLLIAAGGVSVNGTNTTTGASARAASESKGDVIHVGGKGSNSYASNSVIGTATGAGGGAGGPDGNGGNATNASSYTGGTGGTGGGGDAGNGRNGTNVGTSWPGEAQAGYKYGGGGPGAWCTGSTFGVIPNKGLGGPGAQGIVRVTYTYITENIDVENVETTICSGADFDKTLDISIFGFNLEDAVLSSTTPTVDGLTANQFALAYNTSDSKWHVTGTITNSTSATKTAVFNCTGKTPNDVKTVNFTVTVNVYGKLDGGTIAEDQFVCQNQTIQTLTNVQDATGGSGSGAYQWEQKVNVNENNNWGNGTWDQIANANASAYTPTLDGHRYFRRGYVDNVCGTVYSNELQVATVNPLDLGTFNINPDTICSNISVAFTKYLEKPTHYSPGFGSAQEYGVYWQKSTDKGVSWADLSYCDGDVDGCYYGYNVTIAPGEMNVGDDIWYRYAFKFAGCDSIPSNGIYKVHVKEIPDYTSQFEDVNITLWYGACDTSVAALAAPTLTPTPVSVTRADVLDRLAPGEHTITWSVIHDDCDIAVNYNQKVIVEYPVCGTIAEPLTMTDNDGKEYQTIRIGCECWMAENLRTNATDAVYYAEDEANMTFGKLYTWADAVGNNATPKETKSGATYVQGILPNEWAIPTTEQYNKLLLSFSTDELKSDEEGSWLPGKQGTNASGFNLKAGGYFDVTFQRMLGYADFWTAGTNPSDSNVAPVAEVRYDCDGTINCIYKQKMAKMSVRGVRVSPK